MKRFVLASILTLVSVHLSAMPYYSERREGHVLFIFHGNIEDVNQPLVRKLEAEYMEYELSRWHYQNELEELGVHVERIESDDHQPSHLPLDVKKPDLPEGVQG